MIRAALAALVVASVVAVTAVVGMNVPVYWAILIALPAGAVAFAGTVLSGAFDADWAAEPEPAATNVTLHATFLTERLERSATDQYRFTSRVQPRLRRVAAAALRQDLNTRSARDILGADLHHLLTAEDAQLPPPKTFAMLMRRLEEICADHR
jgi:hypothetical protein